MIEGRGGSSGFTMACWKAGADLAGLPWYAGRQDGYRGLPWYTRRQGRIQWVYHGMIEGRGGSRVFTMV